MRLFLPIVMLGLIGYPILTTCKKRATSSDTKTLENFASADGKITINKCKGFYPINNSVKLSVDEKDTSSAEAILDAVSAIPPSLQKLFFEADGGHIFATSDFDEYCSTTFDSLSETEKDFFAESEMGEPTSCIREHSDSQSFILQFKPDAKSIGHHFVRTFGLHFGRLYGPRIYTDWDKVINRLSTTFAREVATSNGKFSLEAYEGMLATSAGQDMFDQFVFGEAFDSYFCTPQTNESFFKNFPQTYGVFDSIAANLKK